MTLVGLNLRELWMSFRLLLVLAALLGSALAVVVASSVPLEPGVVYASALAVASAVAAAAASHWVAADSQRGPAAWLAIRAVPRSSLLLAWLSAFLAPVVGGLLVSAAIAWVTLAAEPALRLTPGAFALALTAVAGAELTAIVIGIAVGTLLAPWRAAVLSAMLALLSAGAAFVLPSSIPLPGGGFALLANLPGADRVTALALQSTGAALVATALLTAAAAAFLQRRDL